jgi:hypothetical protein
MMHRQVGRAAKEGTSTNCLAKRKTNAIPTLVNGDRFVRKEESEF